MRRQTYRPIGTLPAATYRLSTGRGRLAIYKKNITFATSSSGHAMPFHAFRAHTLLHCLTHWHAVEALHALGLRIGLRIGMRARRMHAHQGHHTPWQQFLVIRYAKLSKPSKPSKSSKPSKPSK